MGIGQWLPKLAVPRENSICTPECAYTSGVQTIFHLLHHYLYTYTPTSQYIICTPTLTYAQPGRAAWTNFTKAFTKTLAQVGRLWTTWFCNECTWLLLQEHVKHHTCSYVWECGLEWSVKEWPPPFPLLLLLLPVTLTLSRLIQSRSPKGGKGLQS